MINRHIEFLLRFEYCGVVAKPNPYLLGGIRGNMDMAILPG